MKIQEPERQPSKISILATQHVKHCVPRKQVHKEWGRQPTAQVDGSLQRAIIVKTTHSAAPNSARKRECHGSIHMLCRQEM
jgi:hypothetical protein